MVNMLWKVTEPFTIRITWLVLNLVLQWRVALEYKRLKGSSGKNEQCLALEIILV